MATSVLDIEKLKLLGLDIAEATRVVRILADVVHQGPRSATEVGVHSFCISCHSLYSLLFQHKLWQRVHQHV